jgi:hypothetical protein
METMNHAATVPAEPNPHLPRRGGAQPLPADVRERVVPLFAKVGLHGAADTLGIGPNALCRALAGAPVTRGTVASIRLALAQGNGAR